MANPISDPTLWYDDHVGPPPPAPQWNGSEFEFLGTSPTFAPTVKLDYAGTFPTIAFQVVVLQKSGDPLTFSVVADGTTTSYTLVVGTAQTITVPICSASLKLELTDSNSHQTYNFDVTLSAPSVPVPDCGELGRVTRSFVSGYTAARPEVRRIRRFSKRCLVAEFNGAMPLGCTITKARFDTTSPWSMFMSNPRIQLNQRSIAIDVSFNFAGWGGLKATATWDNGEITQTEFFFTVIDTPLYPSANYPSSNGPYLLETS